MRVKKVARGKHVRTKRATARGVQFKPANLEVTGRNLRQFRPVNIATREEVLAAGRRLAKEHHELLEWLKDS